MFSAIINEQSVRHLNQLSHHWASPKRSEMGMWMKPTQLHLYAARVTVAGYRISLNARVQTNGPCAQWEVSSHKKSVVISETNQAQKDDAARYHYV